MAACAQIGAGQTAEGELSAVGAAADGLNIGLKPRSFNGFKSIFNHVEMGFYSLAHIAVLLFYLQNYSAFSVFPVEKFCGVGKAGFAGLKRACIVVADNIAESSLLNIALHICQVEEALVALGISGGIAGGEHSVELHSHKACVYHSVLGRAGMYIEAVEGDLCAAGVEVLILNSALGAAVCGVGDLCAEALQIHKRCAVTYLLIRAEADGNAAVGKLLLNDGLRHFHYLRNARLVICAEDGGAVGYDKAASLEGRQVGKIRGRESPAACAEDNVAAVIIFDKTGLHILAGEIGDGIKMGDEADAHSIFKSFAGGNNAIDIGVLIHIDLAYAHFAHFLCKHIGKVKLAGGGGSCLARIAAGGVYLNIFQKSFVCFHFSFSFNCFY